MWWQYVVTFMATLFVALIAVHVAHRLSERDEYRKAKESIKHEITVNISICDTNCKQIDTDIDFDKEGRLSGTPYLLFHELAWNTWKSTVCLRNPKIANEIEESYFAVQWTNSLLKRIEELKWGPVATLTGVLSPAEWRIKHFEQAKRYISQTLLPRLKEAKELLEKEG